MLYRLANIVQGIYATVEVVEVYKQECENLSYRCRELFLALRNSVVELKETQTTQVVNEAESTVYKISRRLEKWAALNRVESFLQRAEVEPEIYQSHFEIDVYISKFSIALGFDRSRSKNARIADAERNRAELRDMLQTIAQSMDDLQFILTIPSPHAVEDLMRNFQEELRNPDLAAATKQAFKEGLWILHKESGFLPPDIDLTGQVSAITEYPVACGVFDDICTGQWLGSETVALRPLALSIIGVKHVRFETEIQTRRKLKHPNIVPFYGIINTGFLVYSVSPWMEYTSAFEFLSSHPNTDRLQLLLEVANGMDHLHQNNVVHGGLRGSNVLISKDGTAKLFNFGSPKLLGVIEQTDQVLKHSDVWSFGVLALEVMVVKQIPGDVLGRLLERRELRKPQGLSDDLWGLMLHCWERTLALRPSITRIKDQLAQIRASRDSVSRVFRSVDINILVPFVSRSPIVSHDSSSKSACASQPPGDALASSRLSIESYNACDSPACSALNLPVITESYASSGSSRFSFGSSLSSISSTEGIAIRRGFLALRSPRRQPSFDMAKA